MNKLEIGGKKRDYLFSVAAMLHYEARFGESILEAAQTDGRAMKMTTVIRITYSCLITAARKRGREFTHTFEEVADWFEEPAVLVRAMNLFAEGLGKMMGGAEESSEVVTTAPEGVA